MARHAKAPRLWEPVYFIVDRKAQISTGVGPSSRRDAEAQLAAYLAAKHQPTYSNKLDEIPIADVIALYVREHGPTVLRPDFIAATAAPILEWWGTKTLADVRGETCRAYIKWRTSQAVRQHPNSTLPPRPVSMATARHDLKTLRAAIRFWNAERGPLPALPVVTVPSATEGATRWLTRSEMARLLNAARLQPHGRHLCRFLLIGFYTGTRSAAIFGLSWQENAKSGWINLEGGVIHRRGVGQTETNKRQPPVRIPKDLLPHLRRWQRADAVKGYSFVVHDGGRPISKLRRSWATARKVANLDIEVVPHTLRHTCATHLMQNNVPIFEAAGFLGMDPKMLTDRYGHHHPDFQQNAAKRRPRK